MNDDNDSVFLEFTPEDLNLLALAMDYFLCNSILNEDTKDIVETMFYFLDQMAEEANDTGACDPLIEKDGNLLVVDFTPKE